MVSQGVKNHSQKMSEIEEAVKLLKSKNYAVFPRNSSKKNPAVQERKNQERAAGKIIFSALKKHKMSMQDLLSQQVQKPVKVDRKKKIQQVEQVIKPVKKSRKEKAENDFNQ